MARKVATLLLVFGYCSCMEMRETVERTVMVRTTGSDLQPAATGYIYKKESDGPVSVTKMGESEVIEQFSKLYNTPTAYKESIVRDSTVDLKNEDDVKSESFSTSPHTSTSHDSEKYTRAPQDTMHSHRDTGHGDSASQPSATHTSEDVKPVVENRDDKIDGIANEEFDKLFEDYIKQINYRGSFADYLHSLGHNDHDIYHGHGRGDLEDYYLKKYEYGEKGQDEGVRYPHHEKGELKDDYLIGDHKKYYAYNYKEPKVDFHEDQDHGRHYIHRHNIAGDDHTHDDSQRKGQGVGGFHEGLKLDQLKKNSNFYDGQTFKDGDHAYRGRHDGYGSGAKGYDGKDSHESGHHSGYFRKSDDVGKESRDEHDGVHSSEDSGESGYAHPRDFGTKGQLDSRKSFRYEIKH